MEIKAPEVELILAAIDILELARSKCGRTSRGLLRAQPGHVYICGSEAEAEIARRVLDGHGLHDVRVRVAINSQELWVLIRSLSGQGSGIHLDHKVQLMVIRDALARAERTITSLEFGPQAHGVTVEEIRKSA